MGPLSPAPRDVRLKTADSGLDAGMSKRLESLGLSKAKRTYRFAPKGRAGALRFGGRRLEPLTEIYIQTEVLRMNRKLWTGVITAVFIAALAGAALAHTALFSCWDNGDGTLSCEGGFSDGSSAANIPIRVTDEKGEVVFEGKLDESGELTFGKPQGVFSVTFDGGPGHTLTVKSGDIK